MSPLAWHDGSPYRWPHVLGVSLATSAVTTALTFGAFLDCGSEDPAFEGTTTCRPSFATGATGAGALTGVLGDLLTGWAGHSSLTQRRTFPLMAVGAASAIASYLLVVRADQNDSDTGRTTGLVLSTAGTSLALTLADRLLRVVR